MTRTNVKSSSLNTKMHLRNSEIKIQLGFIFVPLFLSFDSIFFLWSKITIIFHYSLNFSHLVESEIQANFVKQKCKGKNVEPNEPQYNTLNCMSVHKHVICIIVGH